MSIAVKYDEIQDDYERDIDAYDQAIEDMLDRERRGIGADCDADEDSVIVRRKLYRPFARKVLHWLMEVLDNSPQCREAIESFEDSIGSGKVRSYIVLSGATYEWLREHSCELRAYLQGRYYPEVDAFLN